MPRGSEPLRADGVRAAAFALVAGLGALALALVVMGIVYLGCLVCFVLGL